MKVHKQKKIGLCKLKLKCCMDEPHATNSQNIHYAQTWKGTTTSSPRVN
jgi:hypothetical protein